MPVDGTYGRLGAHKQRMKDMRSKRKEKTENSSRKSRFSDPETLGTKDIDPVKLEQIKKEIREKARRSKKRDQIFTAIMIFFTILSVVLFTNWILSL
ncbi:hypothetical protein [Aureitalea marina]|uniref:Uncharacterized protein n=1 Tax=Aureitalea marina TaxID=930804 RepID=A0A2S7KP03_9FLAO|nr:hypothetical protein [Aureitalea marina]PQB04337.1 hypothetical protein BST85_05060 [Aureitalea marina]